MSIQDEVMLIGVQTQYSKHAVGTYYMSDIMLEYRLRYNSFRHKLRSTQSTCKVS